MIHDMINMPLVSVVRPSGELCKVGIDPETTLEQVALMLRLVPEDVIFFVADPSTSGNSFNVGTLMAPGPHYGSIHDKFGKFNTSSIIIKYLIKNDIMD
jgi:hypothetical protein